MADYVDLAASRTDALRALDQVFGAPDRAFAIHYSLQRLRRDDADTLLPVAAIAVRNIATAEQTCFSISAAAQAANIDLRGGVDDAQMLQIEYALLFHFNDFVEQHQGCRFVHWYMRDARFGFEALAERFRYVAAQVVDNLHGGRSVASAALFGYGASRLKVAIDVERELRVDLASIVRRAFGIGPVGLRELAEANGLALAELIDGKDEPSAFMQGKHARLAWSSATKARLISEIAALAHGSRMNAPPARGPRVGGRPLKVFINYRRKDTEAEANWLHEVLSEQLGDENVFIDTDDIPVGSVFENVLVERIARSDVVLALIGSDWADIRDASGTPRLMDAQDYVRREISEALSRNTLIVPVLMEGTRMPSEAQVPTDLAPLLRRQGAVLRVREFRQDVAQLMSKVRAALAQGSSRASVGRA